MVGLVRKRFSAVCLLAQIAALGGCGSQPLPPPPNSSELLHAVTDRTAGDDQSSRPVALRAGQADCSARRGDRISNGFSKV